MAHKKFLPSARIFSSPYVYLQPKAQFSGRESLFHPVMKCNVLLLQWHGVGPIQGFRDASSSCTYPLVTVVAADVIRVILYLSPGTTSSLGPSLNKIDTTVAST